jgi:hypothetical protein
MTKREFSFLLGLVGLAGCAIYDDALRRGSSDAAIDAPRDRALAARDTFVDAARPDAPLSDTEPSRDARAAEDVANIEDAPDANDASDRDDANRERDASGLPPDASNSDVVPDAFADTVVDADSRESGRVGDAPGDAPSDRPIVGCTVDFTVSGVAWFASPATSRRWERGPRARGFR